jgi:hypothetical protein
MSRLIQQILSGISPSLGCTPRRRQTIFNGMLYLIPDPGSFQADLSHLRSCPYSSPK